MTNNMFNIISHWEKNANQTTIRQYTTSIRMLFFFFLKKSTNKYVLPRMWSNWDLNLLLLGMENDAAILENSLAVNYKVMCTL